ncbi:hypothetical protein [Cellulomonas sp. Root137]|uniref:hypothetical protein n=1 Tax=Cellulomonas sp. Root137 TaxID=1736459 RepID=UPI000701EBF1|nr:hypothetical protein [Cellulomonas sp. Root137]KQY43143.1 hypothetical protein ASD18_19505 [Cellulomonas sp. Root137]KRD42747.1 hypothetical protein ASE38_00105 [Cellulomonas sp. Root930]
MSVRGARAIAALCLRCLAVLSVVNGAALTVFLLAQEADSSWAAQVPASIYYLGVALIVAAVLIGLAGFPAGVLTARLLDRTTREWVHVAVFALVGALLSVTLCASFGLLRASGWTVLVAAAEGAIGAGVARWWSGRVQARQTRWTDEEGAALPWGRMTP